MSARLLLLAFAILLALPAYTFYHLFHSGQKPEGLYWAPSGKNGIFAALDSSFRTALDLRKTLRHGERLPSARSHGFKFSTFLDGAIVALPARNFKWLANLPETTASFFKAHEEQFKMSYTIPGATITEPELTRTLVKLLTRRSKGAVGDVQDEIQSACQDVPYGGREWQPLGLFPEVSRILSTTTNRMLMGLPLCRDPELSSVLLSNANTAFPAAVFIRLFPPMLQATIGSLVRTWRMRQYHRSLFQTLVPLFTKLLQDCQERGKSWADEQGSFASWWLQEAISSQNGKAMDPEVLATIVIQLHFAGLHSTAMATTSTLYQILSHEHAMTLVEDLRNEMAQASGDVKMGRWTWACLDNMTLLDSVVRESLRITPVNAVAINRSIVKDVITPDGLHLSPGTRVCAPGYLANMNEQYYADATTFDPYRFVKSNGSAGHEKAWAVTDNFTTFGSGPHVCPGRWLAIAEMKLTIVHFLTHYDFQPMHSMPEGFSIATLLIPSVSHNVYVRDRQNYAHEE